MPDLLASADIGPIEVQGLPIEQDIAEEVHSYTRTCGQGYKSSAAIRSRRLGIVTEPHAGRSTLSQCTRWSLRGKASTTYPDRLSPPTDSFRYKGKYSFEYVPEDQRESCNNRRKFRPGIKTQTVGRPVVAPLLREVRDEYRRASKVKGISNFFRSKLRNSYLSFSSDSGRSSSEPDAPVMKLYSDRTGIVLKAPRLFCTRFKRPKSGYGSRRTRRIPTALARSNRNYNGAKRHRCGNS
jgi:hypothetical protein